MFGGDKSMVKSVQREEGEPLELRTIQSHMLNVDSRGQSGEAGVGSIQKGAEVVFWARSPDVIQGHFCTTSANSAEV